VRLVSFSVHGKSRFGTVVKGGFADLSSLAPDLEAFVARGDEGLARARLFRLYHEVAGF